MPPAGPTRTARYYPSTATEVDELTGVQQRLKIARHSACQSNATASTSGTSRRSQTVERCDCQGYKPPYGARIKSLSIKTNSAQNMDEAQWGWEVCRCGHAQAVHGWTGDALGEEEEEFRRRAKVALRLDELLEDHHKLVDFDYDDEDMQSLRKQMTLPEPMASPRALTRNGVNSLKRKSRSPASTRLSSVEPSVRSREGSASLDSPSTTATTTAKRRRMQSRSRTTSRAVSPTSRRANGGTPEPESGPDDDQFDGEEGQGHGKMPAKSQKGLPTLDEEERQQQGPEQPVETNGHAVDEETGKQLERVEQDESDIARVTKGIAIDTEAAMLGDDGAPQIGTRPPGDELDESAPSLRERPAVVEERSGLIQFRVVTNDGRPESMIILTGLKNIFQRQLPKMPREYITRLVMDCSHWSMAIVKRGLQVVGGITYRPFDKRKFAEIVFCAITSTEQVKGYGSHLMNHLKDHVKKSSEVMHFLTYADNYAIGYFKKQGFKKEITLDRSVWVGYIKDYEGGTLMQCSMLPRVEYLKAQELLASQRMLILNKIRSISKSHVVHPGLDVFRTTEPKKEGEQQRPHHHHNSSSNADPTANFKILPSEVPGLKESAWTVEMDEISRRPRRGPHHNLMRHIVVELGNHQAGWPFTNPVNANEVPDYYEVIKEPMDLSTMETKLENNQYATLDDMVYDAQLIFDNCRTYNPPTSVYAKSANRLERFVKDSLPAWRQQVGLP